MTLAKSLVETEMTTLVLLHAMAATATLPAPKPAPFQPAHLAPWKHIVLEFPITIASGAARIQLFAMEPPASSVQFNPKISIVLGSTDKTAVPSGTIEEQSVKAETTEGIEPMAFRQWKRTTADQSLSNGVRGFVRYEADLYYQGAPTTPGADKPGSLRPTVCANFDNDLVKNFMRRNKITPETVQGYDTAEIVGSVIRIASACTIKNGAYPSASAAVSTGVDCGGRTSLTEAWLRSLGIGCRPNTGWLIWESGKAELHCKPEFLYKGWWIFAEPSRVTANYADFMGINGGKSPHIFTEHRGFDIKAEFKDRDGTTVLFSALTLQYPRISAINGAGKQVSASVGSPKVYLGN